MNAQKHSPATLAEYLKEREFCFWHVDDSAFVLRHVEQVEAAYRQLLSDKTAQPEKFNLNPAAEILS